MGDNETKIYKIIKVIDSFRLVINKGALDGIKSTNRFLIYELGEELSDPDTNESLGKLEIVKGIGKPVHIQDRITTIESSLYSQTKNRTTIVKKRGGSTLIGLGLPTTEEIIEPSEQIQEPFKDPSNRDLAKLIE